MNAEALRRTSRKLADFTLRVLRSLVWPKVDLAVRLWIGQIFLVSGVLKLANWSTALDLATHEYPLSWISPAAAATLGVSVEVVGGALLAIGLMTRYAAVPMFALALISQLSYMPFDNQLFWAALFGWYAVHGAGSLSLDQLLRKGLADSALPLVPRLLRASGWLRERASEIYLSLVRIWLALALLATHLNPLPDGLEMALPLRTMAQLPVPVVVTGALLLTGLGTRILALALLFALSTRVMLDPQVVDQIYLTSLLLLIALWGPGKVSLDSLLAAQLRRRLPQWWGDGISRSAPRARIVIVGAGFAGMACARALRDTPASVILIDRNNHHVFQPLLYQVATAALSPGDIASPIRPLFREQPNMQVRMGTVTGIDKAGNAVLLGEERVPYDYLVVATGATHSYFGKEQWADHAPGLKRIEDATTIRRRILTAFEEAENCMDEEHRKALLTFLIVGGGPTGVELAGAIAELARHGMDREFRNFDPAAARVILVQSAPRLLPAFAPRLSELARTSLEQLGVEVRLGGRVQQIDAQGVAIGDERIAARTVLWAAGVQASPAARWLGVASDNAGRVKVQEDLRVPDLPNVFVIGDTALSTGWRGEAVPGLAPAAKQGGLYVARWLRAKLTDRALPPPFSYRHLGSLATIGRRAAVADFGFVRLWGAPAWWLWGAIHVGFLVGVRNRLSTLVNWFWSYLTFGGGIRLITGAEGEASSRSRMA
ncbi:MAG: FAD-dependent oxidoreductase [Steroidobacteraceae bacterium]